MKNVVEIFFAAFNGLCSRTFEASYLANPSFQADIKQHRDDPSAESKGEHHALVKSLSDAAHAILSRDVFVAKPPNLVTGVREPLTQDERNTVTVKHCF
jgi:hypothetical protein